MGLLRVLVYATIALIFFSQLYGVPLVKYVFRARFVKDAAKANSGNFDLYGIHTVQLTVHIMNALFFFLK